MPDKAGRDADTSLYPQRIICGVLERQMRGKFMIISAKIKASGGFVTCILAVSTLPFQLSSVPERYKESE